MEADVSSPHLQFHFHIILKLPSWPASELDIITSPNTVLQLQNHNNNNNIHLYHYHQLVCVVLVVGVTRDSRSPLTQTDTVSPKSEWPCCWRMRPTTCFLPSKLCSRTRIEAMCISRSWRYANKGFGVGFPAFVFGVYWWIYWIEATGGRVFDGSFCFARLCCV